MKYLTILSAVFISIVSFPVLAQDATYDGMSFFLTSVGPGKGGDLGGLEGADAHCQKLATAAGAESRTWRAYLSTEKEGGRGRVRPITHR